MKPGSAQNSSNLGLEGGVMRLNLLSFFFFFAGWKASLSEGVHAHDLARVLGVQGSYVYMGLLREQGE